MGFVDNKKNIESPHLSLIKINTVTSNIVKKERRINYYSTVHPLKQIRGLWLVHIIIICPLCDTEQCIQCQFYLMQFQEVLFFRQPVRMEGNWIVFWSKLGKWHATAKLLSRNNVPVPLDIVTDLCDRRIWSQLLSAKEVNPIISVDSMFCDLSSVFGKLRILTHGTKLLCMRRVNWPFTFGRLLCGEVMTHGLCRDMDHYYRI